MSSAVRMEREGEIAIFLIDNPPVNAASLAVRRGLFEAVRDVANDGSIEAVVVIGSGNTFVAGADIKEFDKPVEPPSQPEVIASIEDCPKPFVAAIHGAALGGGLELAFGCDARIAKADAVVGLPEVTLGLIPGAGGTQRLPRIVGVAAAIELVCSGRRMNAQEALSLGVVDALAQGDLKASAVAHARGLAGRKRRLRDTPVPAGAPDRIEEASKSALKAGRNRPPVVAAVEVVKASAHLPFDEALKKEREAFLVLRAAPEAAALRYLFFAQRDAARMPELERASPRNISRVGIIGAGTMGVGIAAAFIDAGHDVTLIDQDGAAIARALQRFGEIYERLVTSGRIDAAESARRRARLSTTTDLSKLSYHDLVVEAVFEDMEVKQDVFRRLDALARPGAILATNTSYLDVDKIAAVTKRPQDVVGLHFFSPANVMRLLEVVRGAKTSPEVLATALSIAKKIRKTPVVARVGEGFIGNRIYAAYRRQCELMVEEGAWPEEVDAALTAFGLAMGPFAVSDMAGLDIAWRTRQRLAAARDPKERYVAIADQLCEQGRFGQKTGAGWYRYAPGSRKGEPDPAVREMIEAASRAKGIVRRGFSAEEIRSRALLAMVNEAALLLDEGIAARPSDVDVVMAHGYGFPHYEGGPLFWAARQDRTKLLAELDKLAAASGHGFRKGRVEELLRGLSP